MTWYRGRERLIVFPLVVIAAAYMIHVWSGKQQATTSAALEQMVSTWCEAAARGDDLERQLPAAEPFLARPIARTLATACAGTAPSSHTILARPGPSPGHEHPAATHHVLVVIDDIPRLGLHFTDDHIVGYWIPDEITQRPDPDSG